MIYLDDYFPSAIGADDISRYVCPYTGVEGIKKALECENLYWRIVDGSNIEELRPYVDEDTAQILCSFNENEYTEEQFELAEKRLANAIAEPCRWAVCRGQSCPKAVVLDVTHEYSAPKYYLFCGFSPLPERLPQE